MRAIILDAKDTIFQWALYNEKEPRSFLCVDKTQAYPIKSISH